MRLRLRRLRLEKMCEHKTTITHTNGVRECLKCHTLFIKDTPQMRELYGKCESRCIVWEREDLWLEEFGR